MNKSTMDILARRLNRLERENLWLKRLATFVFFGVVALILLGQAKPLDGAKVVEAERFILRDNSGRVRARLGVFNEKLALAFHDEDGTVRASLTILRDGKPSLNLYDQAGNTRATLGYTELQGTRTLTTLENKRSGMGTKYVTTRTGRVTRSESSLVLFGKDRTVIWRAPDEPICLTCGFRLP
ncbi:MAG: hypothetical protein ACE5MK_13810 [Acidobacteriota bacterium]